MPWLPILLQHVYTYEALSWDEERVCGGMATRIQTRHLSIIDFRDRDSDGKNI